MSDSKVFGLSDWKDGGAITEIGRFEGRGLWGKSRSSEVPLDKQVEIYICKYESGV